MNTEDFNKAVEARIEKIRSTLIKKSAEYSSSTDRMHNFNQGARITNTHPCRVLDGFMLKHYISYRDILDKIEKGEKVAPELIEEKLGDLILYAILQEILINNNNGTI